MNYLILFNLKRSKISVWDKYNQLAFLCDVKIKDDKTSYRLHDTERAHNRQWIIMLCATLYHYFMLKYVKRVSYLMLELVKDEETWNCSFLFFTTFLKLDIEKTRKEETGRRKTSHCFCGWTACGEVKNAARMFTTLILCIVCLC